MKLRNKAYDIAKELITIDIPALSALYVGLSKIWGFPYAEEIAGTLALICTFGGIVLHISSKGYFSDKEIITKTDDDFGMTD